ncbi:MAG: DUF427 domain-containing protein [Actinomycetota bacterium]
MKAILNGTVIAESDDTVVVEGNHYFPASSLSAEILGESDLQTVCGWKGTASYYDVTVDGETYANVVWYYPTPKEKAANITDRVAFGRPVTVEA